MAEITRARTGLFLRTLFKLLMDQPEGLRAADALKALAAVTPLTDFEAGSYPSGGQRFEKIVRFATVDCTKAGWLAKNKGTWTVTEAGAKAYADFPNPEGFYKEACRLYDVWKAARDASTPTVGVETPVEISDGAENLSVSFEQAEEQAWAEIEKHLATSDPFEFQHIVADLLRGMGYHISWVSPPGKDGGIDIIAYTDPLGTQQPRIKVQVKRWQSKIDFAGLQSFIATINTNDVGIYVALSGFTKDAADYARAQENRRVTLIDGQRLVELWIEHYDKLDEPARQRLPLTPIYFLTPKA